MKGLELCKSYYENIGKPELFRIFPEVMGRAAAGLSGQGSDCLGLDDEFSRDHDFGPGFILWLTDADYEKFGAETSCGPAPPPAGSLPGILRYKRIRRTDSSEEAVFHNHSNGRPVSRSGGQIRKRRSEDILLHIRRPCN